MKKAVTELRYRSFSSWSSNSLDELPSLWADCAAARLPLDSELNIPKPEMRGPRVKVFAS